MRNKSKLTKELASVFGCATSTIELLWMQYDETVFVHHKHFRNRTHLCYEEAFIVYLIFSIFFRPKYIIEIGVQTGNSTRRLIDIKNALELKAPIIANDIEDRVRYFEKGREADFVLRDMTGKFKEEVIDRYESGFVYLDAHPYHLIKDVVESCMNTTAWVLAIHDCGVQLCHPTMTISKNDLRLSSRTGHWERHVLSEVFGIKDPMDLQLNKLDTATHRLDIFSTMHGLAVLRPKHPELISG